MPLKTKENMKRLLSKFRKKDPEVSTRITNETVAEHRERILAGGRRFKYPIQYARHKLVINAIIISIVGVIILGVIGWWQLYLAQNTSTFVYNVTRVLPLPVATVDGQPVLYGDYLMRYRSAIHNLQQQGQINLNSEDGKRQADYHKEQAMEAAIADAYGVKLAKQLNLSVSDAELDEYLKSQRQSSDGEISQRTYDASILDILGWSPDEYRQVLRDELLRRKVAFWIDTTAAQTSDSVVTQAKAAGSSFQSIVTATNSLAGSQVIYGAPGFVPKTNQDGGLAAAASKMQKGQVSDVIKATTTAAGDGYYIIRVIDVNDTQVSYEYIQIPLTEFTKRLTNLQTTNKITQYITIPKTTATDSI
jgi:SurA N-terminal domain